MFYLNPAGLLIPLALVFGLIAAVFLTPLFVSVPLVIYIIYPIIKMRNIKLEDYPLKNDVLIKYSYKTLGEFYETVKKRVSILIGIISLVVCFLLYLEKIAIFERSFPEDAFFALTFLYTVISYIVAFILMKKYRIIVKEMYNEELKFIDKLDFKKLTFYFISLFSFGLVSFITYYIAYYLLHGTFLSYSLHDISSIKGFLMGVPFGLFGLSIPEYEPVEVFFSSYFYLSYLDLVLTIILVRYITKKYKL